MAKRQLGIRTIYLCTKGTLASTPTNPIYFGYRNAAEMTIEDHNEIKTVLGQVLSNMTNFKVELPSHEAPFSSLSTLLGFLTSGCDAQIISVPQTSGSVSSGGVFNFNGNNFPGLGFEFTITPKERTLKITLEFATPRDEGLAIISASLTNTPKVTGYGYQAAKRIAPCYISALIDVDSYWDRSEIKDYKVVLKTKDSGKTAYNRDDVNYLTMSYEITSRNAVISELYNILNTDKQAALILSEKYSSSINDVITVNEGVLGRKEKISLGDEKGEYTLSFEGDVPVSDVTVTTNAITIA